MELEGEPAGNCGSGLSHVAADHPGITCGADRMLTDLIKPCMIAHGNFARNGRGDFVEDQVRDCAIIGSAAEDRIGLKLAGAQGFIALVYYDQGPKPREPVLRWIDDDHLSVDLGELKWLTPQIRYLGHVEITYTYSGAEPSLE
jgi:hypothetical protein